MKYRLQGISTRSIARFGCLLGWIVTLFPSLACGLFAAGVLAALRSWLESLEAISLDMLGFEYSLDLIELLKLGDFLAMLQTIQLRTLPLMLALVAVVGILGGALFALTLILVSLGYNLVAWLTGGLELELSEIPVLPSLPADDDNQAFSVPPEGPV